MMKTASKLITGTIMILLVSLADFAIAGDHEGYASYSKQGEFQEVLQDLQDAIINRGLVIDFVGHVDVMLERTSETVGSVTESGEKSPYLAAKYLQFCSAKLTHEAVSANPFNLAVCPYVVFIFEPRTEPGKIIVGYRRTLPGPSKSSRKAFDKIEALLNEISKEAVAD